MTDSPLESAEGAPSAREKALELREKDVSLREYAIAAEEGAAGERNRLMALVAAQMREANENLVKAAVNSQTLTEAAELANRRQDEFLAMLAHELRGPLAPIRNAIAILQRIADAHPQLPWIHDLLKRQTEQLTRLLDDLLDVARVTGGKVVLRKRPVAVYEFVGQAVETSRPLIDSRHQDFTLDIPKQPLYVEGDLSRLTQVLTNLLNNASKYTDKGGSISLAVDTDGTDVFLHLKDNGNGITADMLPRIFELFAQSDRALARAQGGLGIGLTVVRRLIEMHGGTVTAYSAGADQGSEFVITLPVLNAPPELAFDAHAPTSESDIRYRIVLIEDNLDSNKATTTLLVMMGHEVSSAFDGPAGIELVVSKKPQVVICDIGLPRMDGYEVVKRLKERLGEAMPCMVALTGYGQPEDRAAALAAGFDIHLVKPVDPEILMQRIAEYFASQKK